MRHRFGKVVNQQHTYNRKENKGSDIKWTDKAGVAVQAFSIIITLFLFREVIRQNKIAERSTVLADSSAMQAKRSADAAQRSVDYADSAFKLAQLTFNSSDSTSKITLELSKRSLQAQMKYSNISESNFLMTAKYAARADSNYLKSIGIASNSLDISKESIKLVQKNFEIENKPYILFNNIKLDSIGIDRPQQITVFIKNFGKIPALILYTKTGIMLDTSLDPKTLNYDKENVGYFNIFIPTGAEIELPYKTFLVARDLYMSLLAQKEYLFVYGEVLYKDNVTSKTYSYVYCMRILNNRRFAPTPFNNVTYEIK